MADSPTNNDKVIQDLSTVITACQILLGVFNNSSFKMDSFDRIKTTVLTITELQEGLKGNLNSVLKENDVLNVKETEVSEDKSE